MSRVDTRWLRMDNDVRLMVIVGVWLLTPAFGLQALRERIGDKLLKYARLRQKAVRDATGAHRAVDEGFDISRQVLPELLQRQPGATRLRRAADTRRDPAPTTQGPDAPTLDRLNAITT
jgi:hypothetical protein